MKLEIHECDRCGNRIEEPKESVYTIEVDCNTEISIQELCCLCHEALLYWIQGKAIPDGLRGVVENEKRFYEEVATSHE